MRLRLRWRNMLVAVVLVGFAGVTAGAAAFPLANTPLIYALTERATHDRIPLLGGGRADATDGRVFPYVFTPRLTSGA